MHPITHTDHPSKTSSIHPSKHPYYIHSSINTNTQTHMSSIHPSSCPTNTSISGPCSHISTLHWFVSQSHFNNATFSKNVPSKWCRWFRQLWPKNGTRFTLATMFSCCNRTTLFLQFCQTQLSPQLLVIKLGHQFVQAELQQTME